MPSTIDLPTDLYHQVQGFYAYQMQLLDRGAAQEWAQTFTPDGVFAANAHPEPTRGRDAIAAAARKASDDLAARGIRRRHWLGMVQVTPTAEGARATSYALIIETPRGGQATVRMSTTCEDDLVRGEDGWQVRHRQVRRDDLD
ncbi:nuclear transport factor 2 family protein [Micromonospora auratinigra]|uniref:SnoaL-like domain-containing protein n=1 Tax=Micromonospora auratinigra TaxID=261654 RepID=A0A1A8ZG89_9ACTN|nr:nuclear transport factor 2 family protein [Micromonospora auratinigra]SBT42882.1 SnoaL-like domain-containing protein [Micromonospora auratinigra]